MKDENITLTIRIIKEEGGNSLQESCALTVLENHPKWHPREITAMIMKYIIPGMTKEQVEIAWGKPTFTRICPQYIACWWSQGNNKRNFMAFTNDEYNYNVLFYSNVDNGIVKADYCK